MKPESALWQEMRAKFLLPGDRADRIENSFGEGIPDTSLCLAGEDVWVELKAPLEPKRATTVLMTSNGNHALLQSQINWFARQRQAKGVAFIIIGTDQRVMLVDGVKHADHFNTWTVKEMMSNSLDCFPRPVGKDQWRILRNVIFTAARYRRLHLHAQAQHLLSTMEREQVDGGSVARRSSRVEARPDPPRGNRRGR